MLVDLTHPFSDGMFSLRLFPRVTVERCVRIEERRINVTRVEFAVHAGTHLDAPRHFLPDGKTVEQLALEDVSGPAVALAVRRAGGEEITVADLADASPTVRPGDIVFVSTDWARYFYGDPERYRDHPYLSREAAEWLVERRVKLIGVDVPTPDQPEWRRAPGFDWPVHHILLGHGVLVAEHVNNLQLVVGKRFRVFAFPIPIRDSDGSPVRIVAEVPDDEPAAAGRERGRAGVAR
ncbi:MAG: cyclase family protein [Chloroflexota bacterium]|nr:cyclase family protein [Chloroflexota bacterium]